MENQIKIEDFDNLTEIKDSPDILENAISFFNETEAPEPENVEIETETETETESKGLADKYNDVKDYETGQNSNETLTGMIDAGLIVVLGDIILSRTLFFVFNKFLKKDVSISDFELTPEENKATARLLKEYLKTVDLKVTPGQALLFGVLSIYAGKALIAFTMPEKEKSEPIKTIKQQTKSTGKRGRPKKIVDHE
jgi:hypothetical protein